MILRPVFPTKNPGNVEGSKELNFFCIRLKGRDILFLVILTFFGLSGKNSCAAFKSFPPVIEPNWKGVWAIVVNIEEPGMGLKMVKERTIPCHSIIIVIKCLRRKWYKAFFLKWIFQLLST